MVCVCVCVMVSPFCCWHRIYLQLIISTVLIHLGLDPAVCKHMELSGTTCQGNLYKLGGNGFWKNALAI